jgi:hypothetical protein
MLNNINFRYRVFDNSNLFIGCFHNLQITKGFSESYGYTYKKF